MQKEIIVPKIIFIIPYRDRLEQKFFFKQYMTHIMEDYSKEDYEIYFSHQTDNREFNRGGTKNIGFLAMKNKYPNHYKNITFVFNDIDTIPHKKNIIDYKTNSGTIKHFYGFKYALGGIFSITGEDFEKLNGFPNYWGWGFEDNSINNRAMVNKLTIDRSTFWHIGNKNIIQLFDSCARSILVENKKRYISDSKKKDYSDGLSTITNLNYNINNDMINIKTFDCKTTYNPDNISDVNFFTTQKNNMFKMKNANLNQGNPTTMNNDKNKKVITTTKTKPLNNKSRFKMF